MDTLVINISWEYFLGIMGGLIGIAYYAKGHFGLHQPSLRLMSPAAVG